MPLEIEVSQIKDVVVTPQGNVILKVTATVGETQTELEVAMAAATAQAVGTALLVSAATETAGRRGGVAALDVLAAAVVASGSAERVQLQLLLQEGPVLPVEMPLNAVHMLGKDLLESLGEIIRLSANAPLVAPTDLGDLAPS